MPIIEQDRKIPGSKHLKNLLRNSDTFFLKFVLKCLEWDPNERIKAS